MVLFCYTRNMKSTLIFSDLHLGENVCLKRLNAFIEICESFDLIILNGDFLDDFWCYDKTIESDWSPLFDFFKTKEVIYIFGNHDHDTVKLRNATIKFIDLYCDEYLLSVGKIELCIQHGHHIYPRPDGILYKKKTTWRGKLFQKMVKNIWYFLYPIILKFRFFIERFPKTLVHIQRPFVILQNKRMKKYAADKLEPHQILVCGHSHLAEFSPEKKFINCGANSYNRIEYISVRDGEIKLIVKELL